MPILKYFFYLKRMSKKLSFRASAFAFIALIIALLTVQFSFLVPDGWAKLLGEHVVDDILKILASSMLLVVTFSITTMATSFAAASEGVTPRATRLLIDDSQSQNVISIFLGAFIFSMVSIIALSTGYYGTKEKFVLFVVTVLLITLVVSTIIRWIEKISKLGRVHETIQVVEKATLKAIQSRAKNPTFKCKPYVSPEVGTTKVRLDEVGYIELISFGSLQEIAVENDLQIYVEVQPGTYVSSDLVVAYLSKKDGELTEEVIHKVTSCFSVGSARTFDEDPRFGFITLSETASRALSPGVNDPGTAIDVIGSMIRLFTKWSQCCKDSQEAIKHDRVYLRRIKVESFFDDIVNPISRDGAKHIEVVIRLYKAMLALEQLEHAEINSAAREYKERIINRAEQSLVFDDDKEKIRSKFK